MLERPLVIGVVGGSGSGKTTVTRAIYDMPGVDAAFIDQDAYYLDLAHLPLEERKRLGQNYRHERDLRARWPRADRCTSS